MQWVVYHDHSNGSAIASFSPFTRNEAKSSRPYLSWDIKPYSNVSKSKVRLVNPGSRIQSDTNLEEELHKLAMQLNEKIRLSNELREPAGL